MMTLGDKCEDDMVKGKWKWKKWLAHLILLMGYCQPAENKPLQMKNIIIIIMIKYYIIKILNFNC